MSYNKEFLNIVSDILENEEFQKLKNIKHHDTDRFDHSLRVSYYSYLITKALRLNYKATARAGLLHDFFLEENYKIDDLRYNFNGVIISRNKVLRNYELLIRHGQGGKFEALMYALTKNSILNEEEFNLVFDCAKKVLEKRGR